MSNSNASPAPVVWPLVVAVIGVFAIFIVIVSLARTPVTPLTAAANVPEELQWKLTPEGRQDRRVELEGNARANQQGYAWINQSEGTVRLPLDRAIDLTLAEINADR